MLVRVEGRIDGGGALMKIRNGGGVEGRVDNSGSRGSVGDVL